MGPSEAWNLLQRGNRVVLDEELGLVGIRALRSGDSRYHSNTSPCTNRVPSLAPMVIVGVIGETAAGESRVALTPAVVPALTSGGIEVVVAAGAGTAAGFSDDAYREKGARVGSREEALVAQVIARVQATDSAGILPDGSVVIGMCRPLAGLPALREMAERGVTVFAMELMPRITRAQSMDALSSQATIAGYKAALLAALNLPKIFPMMTTAAGTLAPARVLVVGAGVAGLQAIAPPRRPRAGVHAC